MASDEHPAITRFREYLRIKTVQPTPDYATCTKFLLRQADELGLASKVFEYSAGKPIVVLTWEGCDPSLKSLVLNSHTDVVPVFEDQWMCDPFEAKKLDNGDIVARGVQDMKCVGASYLEAIRNLKSKGKLPLRTIHLTYVPDEEIGGVDGMGAFVNSGDFKTLNAGFALDEGLANNGNALKVYYGERAVWWVDVTVRGRTGHGSQFIEDTAMSKLRRIIDRFMDFRDAQEMQMKIGIHSTGRKYTLGDVTTVNLTKLQAGVQYNVVPEVATASFDIRVTPEMDMSAFKRVVEQFVLSEKNAEISFAQYHATNHITHLDDTNVWWQVFQNCCKDLKIHIEPEIFPAGTDARYLRAIGVPALGVSYIKNTPILLHDHNERLNEQVYLEGIDFYTKLIEQLANIRKDESPL